MQQALAFPEKIDGDELLKQLENMLKSLAGNRAGEERPSDVQVSETWLCVATTVWRLYLWTGESDVLILSVDTYAGTLHLPGVGSVASLASTTDGSLAVGVGSDLIVMTERAVRAFVAGYVAAITSQVGAYTRQQYAVPVALTGQSGSITLDADQHQDVHITATGNITLAAPANPVFGKTIFLTLYSDSALTITWNSIFKGNADFPTLDAAFVAGKRLFLQFRYVENVGWVLMGRAQEA